jgi:hypothetical protein
VFLSANDRLNVKFDGSLVFIVELSSNEKLLLLVSTAVVSLISPSSATGCVAAALPENAMVPAKTLKIMRSARNIARRISVPVVII